MVGQARRAGERAAPGFFIQSSSCEAVTNHTPSFSCAYSMKRVDASMLSCRGGSGRCGGAIYAAVGPGTQPGILQQREGSPQAPSRCSGVAAVRALRPWPDGPRSRATHKGEPRGVDKQGEGRAVASVCGVKVLLQQLEQGVLPRGRGGGGAARSDGRRRAAAAGLVCRYLSARGRAGQPHCQLSMRTRAALGWGSMRGRQEQQVGPGGHPPPT